MNKTSIQNLYKFVKDKEILKILSSLEEIEFEENDNVYWINAYHYVDCSWVYFQDEKGRLKDMRKIPRIERKLSPKKRSLHRDEPTEVPQKNSETEEKEKPVVRRGRPPKKPARKMVQTKIQKNGKTYKVKVPYEKWVELFGEPGPKTT